MGVGVGQGGALGCGWQAQMAQFAFTGGQAVGDVAQAVDLNPTGRTAWLPTGPSR